MYRALRGVWLAGALLAGCAGTGGTYNAVVTEADEATRTIVIGGETVYVPDNFDFSELMPGSRYRVAYERQDGRNVLVGFAEIGTTGGK